ncbi:ribosomal RNA processing protein 1 homolog B [Chanos chanos]|uniref:Ribosomal RNA processing protein 1 homolog B n=1 Tax=Chanos chanos TaxID=29144 RepID=A0A6J2WGK8_CHACN|nr:ribosomal RNA processing protein 1 homolog B-like [Chanos chanos]
MAPTEQDPEIILAQRLASNEKSMRTKAMNKLRKYISLRSQKSQGGFTPVELLKVWKGLFYCLWMQDKPLLQEELSNRISTLIHSFQSFDSQLLFFEAFLQTVKREWNGIDRLRMDKFYQLVRFVFREVFDVLKRKEWEASVVNRFLELFSAQLLHSSSAAPTGLMLHILDLYMTELARVGSEELTAQQNLSFIKPFCKTMAKTKDRILLKSISCNIFNTIVDQAPFAIEDLMKELKEGEGDADSGQASGEDGEEKEEEDQHKSETATKSSKKPKGKQVNGVAKANSEEEVDIDMEDEDEDDVLDMDDMDPEREPDDEDIGPILQFDYATIADHLFALASRSNTPSCNRNKIYKLVKTFRDLSEGVFPQDEIPEDVSSSSDEDDYDDDLFDDETNTKKRKKRKGREKEEGESPAKKQKANQADSPGDATSKKKKKKRKKKKKKKTGEGKSGEGESVTENKTENPEENTAEATAAHTDDVSKVTVQWATDSEKTDTPPPLEVSEAETKTVSSSPVQSALDGDSTDISKTSEKSYELVNTIKITIETEKQDVSTQPETAVAATEPESQPETVNASEGEVESQFEPQGAHATADGQSDAATDASSNTKKRRKSKRLKAVSQEAEEVEGTTTQPASENASSEKEAKMESVSETQAAPDGERKEETGTAGEEKKKKKEGKEKTERPEGAGTAADPNQTEPGADDAQADEQPVRDVPGTPKKKKSNKKKQKSVLSEEQIVEAEVDDKPADGTGPESSDGLTDDQTGEITVDASLENEKETTVSEAQTADLEPCKMSEAAVDCAVADTADKPAQESCVDMSVPTPLKQKKKQGKRRVPETDDQTKESEMDLQAEAALQTEASPDAVLLEPACAVEQPADVTVPTPSKKKKTPKKRKAQLTEEQAVEAESEKEPTATSDCADADSNDKTAEKSCADTSGSDKAAEEGCTDNSLKKKQNKKQKKKLQPAVDKEADEVDCAAAAPAVSDDQSESTDTPAPLKKQKKKLKKQKAEEINGESQPETGVVCDVAAVADGSGADEQNNSTATPLKKKGKKKQKSCQVETEPAETEAGSDLADAADTNCADDTQTESSPVTPLRNTKKKKRKLVTAGGDTAQMNGFTEQETGGKKPKISIGAEEVSTPTGAKKSKQRKKKLMTSPDSEFIKFQSKVTTPTPLFCKTKMGSGTPLGGKKTPKSETKKVTFGLKNNKTAEFRKTDRSLLLSPDGSSRVAFDPKRTPKCGVLKSPISSPVVSIKKKVPKTRPTAADFF